MWVAILLRFYQNQPGVRLPAAGSQKVVHSSVRGGSNPHLTLPVAAESWSRGNAHSRDHASVESMPSCWAGFCRFTPGAVPNAVDCRQNSCA